MLYPASPIRSVSLGPLLFSWCSPFPRAELPRSSKYLLPTQAGVEVTPLSPEFRCSHIVHLILVVAKHMVMVSEVWNLKHPQPPLGPGNRKSEHRHLCLLHLFSYRDGTRNIQL